MLHKFGLGVVDEGDKQANSVWSGYSGSKPDLSRKRVYANGIQLDWNKRNTEPIFKIKTANDAAQTTHSRRRLQNKIKAQNPDFFSAKALLKQIFLEYKE